MTRCGAVKLGKALEAELAGIIHIRWALLGTNPLPNTPHGPQAGIGHAPASKPSGMMLRCNVSYW
jgi:hypothetical protein